MTDTLRRDAPQMAQAILERIEQATPFSRSASIAVEGGHTTMRPVRFDPKSANFESRQLFWHLPSSAKIPELPHEVGRSQPDSAGLYWLYQCIPSKSDWRPEGVLANAVLFGVEPFSDTEARTYEIAAHIHKQLRARGFEAVLATIIGDLELDPRLRFVYKLAPLPVAFAEMLRDLGIEKPEVFFESECRNRGDQISRKRVRKFFKHGGTEKQFFEKTGIGIIRNANPGGVHEYALFSRRTVARRSAKESYVMLTKSTHPSCAVSRGGLNVKLHDMGIRRHIVLHDKGDDGAIDSKVEDGCEVALHFGDFPDYQCDVVTLTNSRVFRVSAVRGAHEDKTAPAADFDDLRRVVLKSPGFSRALATDNVPGKYCPKRRSP